MCQINNMKLTREVKAKARAAGRNSIVGYKLLLLVRQGSRSIWVGPCMEHPYAPGYHTVAGAQRAKGRNARQSLGLHLFLTKGDARRGARRLACCSRNIVRATVKLSDIVACGHWEDDRTVKTVVVQQLHISRREFDKLEARSADHEQ